MSKLYKPRLQYNAYFYSVISYLFINILATKYVFGHTVLIMFVTWGRLAASQPARESWVRCTNYISVACFLQHEIVQENRTPLTAVVMWRV